MPATVLPRVVATEAALALLKEIRAEHGDVVFQLSGGCCDGTGPMCFRVGDVRIGAGDRKLGEADGAEIWVSSTLFLIWERSQLILDAGPGSGDGFSLDNGRDTCFLAKSRFFTEEEFAQLAPAVTAGAGVTSAP